MLGTRVWLSDRRIPCRPGGWKVDSAMNFRRWVMVYLLTGSSFTRLAILAYYGGGVIVLALVALAALYVIGSSVRLLSP